MRQAQSSIRVPHLWNPFTRVAARRMSKGTVWQPPRGTKDLLDEELVMHRFIVDQARKCVSLGGFEEV